MFRQEKVIITDVKSHSRVPIAVEQFAGQKFFENGCGWITNDIAAAMACTTMEQYRALADRLVESPAKFGIKNPKEKIADSIKRIMPRWCQSPNEIQNFAESIVQSSLDDAYTKALEDVKLSKDSKDGSDGDAPSGDGSDGSSASGDAK